MPWGAALALTLVGAVMVVVGLTVVGRIGAPTNEAGALPGWVVPLVVIPTWGVIAVVALRRMRARRGVIADAAVPDVLTEPPSDLDPAVVGVVVGRGRATARAVAATTLGLAARRRITIHEVGDRVVVTPDATPADATPLAPTDTIVLQALGARADAASGDTVGPPLWPADDDWWHAYARDARDRAIAAGFVESRIPLVAVILVCVLTATAMAIAIFWYTVAFVGLILMANGIPHLLVRASGYRLSRAGLVERARWVAFGRSLRERGGLAAAGPASVAVWGPYLVYGVLMGAGSPAIAVLTPDVARDTELPPDLTETWG